MVGLGRVALLAVCLAVSAVCVALPASFSAKETYSSEIACTSIPTGCSFDSGGKLALKGTFTMPPGTSATFDENTVVRITFGQGYVFALPLGSSTSYAPGDTKASFEVKAVAPVGEKPKVVHRVIVSWKKDILKFRVNAVTGVYVNSATFGEVAVLSSGEHQVPLDFGVEMQATPGFSAQVTDHLFAAKVAARSEHPDFALYNNTAINVKGKFKGK